MGKGETQRSERKLEVSKGRTKKQAGKGKKKMERRGKRRIVKGGKRQRGDKKKEVRAGGRKKLSILHSYGVYINWMHPATTSTDVNWTTELWFLWDRTTCHKPCATTVSADSDERHLAPLWRYCDFCPMIQNQNFTHSLSKTQSYAAQRTRTLLSAELSKDTRNNMARSLFGLVHVAIAEFTMTLSSAT